MRYLTICNIVFPCILAFFCTLKSTAQQHIKYSQYIFSGITLNPAYTGIENGFSLTSIYRDHWSNIKGSPKTLHIIGEGNVSSKNIGIGVQVYSTRMNDFQDNGLFLSYAYELPIYKRYDLKLRFGLQAGFSQYLFDFSNLNIQTASPIFDPVFSKNRSDYLSFNTGAGVFLKGRKFYLAFGMPHFLNTNSTFYSKESTFLFREMNLTAGVTAVTIRWLKVRTNLLVSKNGAVPLLIDWNTSLQINTVLWLGLSYRVKESIGLMFGLRITPQIRILYSYDMAVNTTTTKKLLNSHEFFLTYFFSIRNKKLKSPRFF